MILAILAALAIAQTGKPFPADPAMPAYELPAAFPPGTNAAQWTGTRRGEVLNLFRDHVYGRVPGTKCTQTFHVAATDAKALNGTATLKEIDIVVARGEVKVTIRLNLFTPNAAKGPVPAYLLICNRGKGAADPTRLQKAEFWPVEQGIARGYAMAAFLNSDVAPDVKDNTQQGAFPLLDVEPRDDRSWGTLAAWAWGASRCMDYLVQDQSIDAKRVAVIGHSRGGKTALWAGAEDERFALVISNNSGCGGASISRRKFEGKEQVARINKSFPHWFCGKFKEYGDNEAACPVDQHELLALIAPRALAVGSAFDDKWADPRGEFLSLTHAEPVYQLLGKKGLGTKDMPAAPGTIDGDQMHYHIRLGKHDLTLQDWTAYWNFGDQCWKQ